MGNCIAYYTNAHTADSTTDDEHILSLHAYRSSRRSRCTWTDMVLQPFINLLLFYYKRNISTRRHCHAPQRDRLTPRTRSFVLVRYWPPQHILGSNHNRSYVSVHAHMVTFRNRWSTHCCLYLYDFPLFSCKKNVILNYRCVIYFYYSIYFFNTNTL